jgi:hypothetical protein
MKNKLVHPYNGILGSGIFLKGELLCHKKGVNKTLQVSEKPIRKGHTLCESNVWHSKKDNFGKRKKISVCQEVKDRWG